MVMIWNMQMVNLKSRGLVNGLIIVDSRFYGLLLLYSVVQFNSKLKLAIVLSAMIYHCDLRCAIGISRVRFTEIFELTFERVHTLPESRYYPWTQLA